MDTSNKAQDKGKISNNGPSQQENHIIEEENQESSNFTQRQIQVIRSYISNMDLDKKQKESLIPQIAKRIQTQTELQSKSAKQIQFIINRILSSQSSSSSQKPQNTQQFSKVKEIIEPVKQSPVITIKEQQKQPKRGLFFQSSNQQAVFQPKSIFRSFNQTGINFSGLQSGFTQNNATGTKKVNLVTRPSIQLIKKNSTGFMSLNDKNTEVNRQAMESEYNGTIQMPSFSKKGTKQFKQTSQTFHLKSKRKIKPTLPLVIDSLLASQQKIEWIQSNTSDCHSILQKKLQKKPVNPNKQSFYVNQKFTAIYNEYFYSNYDKIYFKQESHLNTMFGHLELDPKRMSFKDFKLVKQALPIPRLFNIEFIIGQQNMLNQFRCQLRQLPKDRNRSEDLELVVGRQVTALHPVCGHLHNGTILAIYKENQYMLGTQKVLDINISTRFLSNTNKATVQNIDYEAMVTVIKLLEYKGELIQKFKEYNNIIQELRQANREPDNALLQEYGWIGSTINILTMGMRHIIAKFRIRGLNVSNQQLVGKNFSSLLINPLNLMSKQLENSSQLSDIQTSNQITKMAANRSTSRIQQLVSKLSIKNNHFLEQSELNPEQRQSMSMLLKNFLAMLLNLRFQGRNFNIESNKYLNNILAMIDGEYSEYFNEIYANIHSIVKKISEVQ